MAADSFHRLDDEINKQKLRSSEDLDTALLKLRLTKAELLGRLQQEQKAHATIGPTVERTWETTLALAKSDELKACIRETSTAFEKDVELKEEKLKALQQEVDGINEYNTYMLQAHARAIDGLLRVQQARIRTLHEDFMTQLKQIKASFEDERDDIVARHVALKTELLHVIKAANDTEEQKAFAAEAKHTQSREQIRRRGIERIHTLQTELDASIEILERAFAEAHARYLSATDQRVQDFKALAARGQYETHLKEKQKRMINRYQKRLEVAQALVFFVEREEKEKNAVLMGQKAMMQKDLNELKARMSATQQERLLKLRAVASKSDQTRGMLSEQVSLAQKVLLCAEELRQMEPFYLRVSPYATIAGNPTPSAAPTAAVEVVELQEEPTVPSGHGMDHEAEVMELFYRRYNAGLLEKLALEKRQHQLQEENEQLKMALQQCLDASTLTEDKPASGVLIINGRGAPNPAISELKQTSYNANLAVHASNIARHLAQ